MSHLTDYQEAAAVIEAFIDGRSGKWDWDDYTSIKKKDDFLESVRLRCARACDDYPAKDKGVYCSADGIAVLRALAQEIRKKISSIQNGKPA